MDMEQIMKSVVMNGKRNTGTNSTQSETTCPKCGGTGWVVNSENMATQCECMAERIMNGRILFANIPEAFKEMRLSSFRSNYYRDQETLNKAVKNIKYWLEHIQEMKDQGLGLYFYSNTKGSGKTRMAASIANELIYEHNMSVRFVTSLDIIAEIRSTWDRDNIDFTSESQLMHYLNNTEVLVIDDFGTEKHNEQVNWIDDKFYQIINTRYTRKLITIFTSNYSLKQLNYDERIVNRIVERTYPIKFPEESVREVIAAIRQEQILSETGV